MLQRFVEKERVSGIFFSATEVVWCRAVWRLVGRDAPFFFFFFFAAVRAVRLSVDASFPPPRGRRRRGHDDVVEHFSSLVELLLSSLLLLLLLPRSFLRLLYNYSKGDSMTQKMNNTNTNNLNVSPRIRRQQRRRRRRRRGFFGGGSTLEELWWWCPSRARPLFLRNE